LLVFVNTADSFEIFVKYILIENGEYKCFYFDGTKIISRFDKQEEEKVNSFINKGIWKEIEPQEAALL